MGMRRKREAGIREESGRISTLSSSGASINVSSSGLTQGSRNKESRKGDESGRSMVEMLGVLAIMGVLVIGGIAGYRYAMDKYNANEIINEVKKRVLVASQQRIQNQEIDLKEFYPNDMADMILNRYEVVESNSYNNDAGFFSLTVFDLPEKACNAILRMDWSLPIEIKIGESVVQDGTTCPAEELSYLTFAFSNTLDQKEVPIDYCKDIHCPEGTQCNKGVCLCPNMWTQCGGICCANGEICSTSGEAVGSFCLPPKGDEGCTKNEDCPSGNYCDYSAAAGCTTPNTGTCQKLEDLPDSKEVIGLGKTWLGPVNLTWWSAKNWCLAHGKRLLNIRGNTLQCYDKNLGNGSSNRWNYGFCNKDVTGIQNANPNAERSIVIQSLVDAYGDVKLWTDTDASNCLAWTVILGDSGYFATDSRIHKPAVVLCTN